MDRSGMVQHATEKAGPKKGMAPQDVTFDEEFLNERIPVGEFLLPLWKRE
jgi:hypothetical protein